MNQAQGESISTKRKPAKKAEQALAKRVDQARDIVEEVRDRAELVMREKPYILPIAAGALGLGVGALLGSKLVRFVVFTAAGTVVSEVFGGELRRMAQTFISELRERLAEGDDEGGEEEIEATT